MARTFALIGIDAEPVHVEVDVARGLPAFTIVGLPDAAVRESRERVRAALVNSGFEFPLRRITANLAPADLRKAGPGFDLAIAAALLVASNQVPAGVLERYSLAGELALDGAIRPVPGALSMAEATRSLGLRGVAVAVADREQAAFVAGIEVVALEHVSQLAELARGELEGDRASGFDPGSERSEDGPDLADLRGQPSLRRALEVAAAGGHSLLLVGPPGAGKTLAARRLPSLLPPLAPTEAVEVMRIAGACANGARPSATRPFRAPHHTASARALIGGGLPPRPGEITRAHRGVLFLDELGEFHRDALEALRQPLEEGRISISRGGRTVSLPCRFMLVAASNPCPCGRGPDSGECDCHQAVLARYRAKLSGALADRIDIRVGVDRPDAAGLAEAPGERSRTVRERVCAARERQRRRLGEGRCNADIGPDEIRRACPLRPAAERILRDGHELLGLSGRGWDRIVRVARTIA
ncbi:MAG: YifB family Mg chelatase-like AAA ATPase, partial [Actinomycetota bacterium]|nr:YifB family Mg chelatase-like AAA ATPase [Actinomycetota bacterium]